MDCGRNRGTSDWYRHRQARVNGKTIAMCKTIQQYQNDHPFDTIYVVTPSQKLNKMWKDELDRHQISNYHVVTYMSLVNSFRKGIPKIDCMICDECHRLATPVQGRVLNARPRAVLGCSATPEGAKDILGKPLVDIGVNEANLCDFTVHYTIFHMTPDEAQEYDDITKRMVARAQKVTNGASSYLPPNRDTYGWGSYDALARKRRDICYKQASRIPATVALVRKHIGQNIVIYTERRETIPKIISALNDYDIRAVGDNNVALYESGQAKVLVLCGRLREGWNKVDTNVVILSSVNTGVIKNIQTIGRALRVDPNDPEKHAHIYMLIAEGTSDERIIQSTSKYYKGHCVQRDIKSETGNTWF